MADNSKKRLGRWVLAVIAAVLAFFWLVGELFGPHSSKSNEPVSPTTGNPGQDSLLNETPDRQALLLAAAVGGGCEGRDAFYMGSSGLTAIWSVRCKDGRSYGVEIQPDAGGSTKVLSCEELETLAQTPCFTKLRSK